MLLLGVAIFCADFAFQSPVTTHRAALIFSYLTHCSPLAHTLPSISRPSVPNSPFREAVALRFGAALNVGNKSALPLV